MPKKKMKLWSLYLTEEQRNWITVKSKEMTKQTGIAINDSDYVRLLINQTMPQQQEDK